MFYINMKYYYNQKETEKEKKLDKNSNAELCTYHRKHIKPLKL